MTKGAATKQTILGKAAQVASRTGLGGLTIGGLAAETGMSKSGLYAHFDSKESLQIDVLEFARRQFVDLVLRPAMAEPRGLARMTRLFHAWIAWDDGEKYDGGCLFAAAASELDDRPGPARDALVRAERDWLDALATVAATAVSEGQLAADLDVDQFAYEEHAIMLAHHHAHRLLADPRAHERSRCAFDSLVASARRAV